jgi:hypothetical protein
VITSSSLPIEGLWEIRGQGTYYRMRIARNSEGNVTGIVEKADSIFWFPGQVKLVVKQQEGNYYRVRYFARDHVGTDLVVNIDADGLLICGPYGIWQRVGDESFSKRNDSLVKAKNRPGVSMLASGTAYLRVPSFDISVKNALESILAANQELLQSENMVIDIRNNTGGSTLVSGQLLNYILDGPIEHGGSKFLSSAQNLADIDSMYHRPAVIHYYKQFMKDRIERMAKHPDSLVVFTERQTYTPDSIYPTPKHVYIITNKASASTSEIFVLQARQSKKVKVVGDYTAGLIDYLDLSLDRTLPCPLFYYRTPMTRADHVNTQPLDPTGIEPSILVPAGQDALEVVKKLIGQQ